MELVISKDFTIEDIHKIREYNHEMTKGMSLEEQNRYYKRGADEMLRLMAELKKKKEVAYH